LAMFSKNYFRFLTVRFELFRKAGGDLRRLLNSGEISNATYKAIDEKIKSHLLILEERWKRLIDKARIDIEELEKTVRLLEVHLAKVEISYSVGEISEETHKERSESITSGLNLLRNELKKTRELLEGLAPPPMELPEERIRMILRELPMERAFYFYADYGRYTGRYARSLEEFTEAVEKAEIRSLRFHLPRGDFQVWIRDLGDPDLALAVDGFRRLELGDEELKRRVHGCLRDRVEDLKRNIER